MRRSRAQPEKSIRSFQNSVPLLLTVGKTVVSVSTSNFHRLLSPVIYAEPAVWILLPLIFHFIYNNQTRTHCLLSFIRKTGRDYPCLCLCFGFSQITLILPFLLMILHFSQIGFTDDLTFISIHHVLSVPFRNLQVFKKDRFTLYHGTTSFARDFPRFFNSPAFQ